MATSSFARDPGPGPDRNIYAAGVGAYTLNYTVINTKPTRTAQFTNALWTRTRTMEGPLGILTASLGAGWLAIIGQNGHCLRIQSQSYGIPLYNHEIVHVA